MCSKKQKAKIKRNKAESWQDTDRKDSSDLLFDGGEINRDADGWQDGLRIAKYAGCQKIFIWATTLKLEERPTHQEHIVNYILVNRMFVC